MLASPFSGSRLRAVSRASQGQTAPAPIAEENGRVVQVAAVACLHRQAGTGANPGMHQGDDALPPWPGPWG